MESSGYVSKDELPDALRRVAPSHGITEEAAQAILQSPHDIRIAAARIVAWQASAPPDTAPAQ